MNVKKAPQIEVRRENWRIDPDGMLRVTANILKHGVFPYARDDSYGALPDALKARIGNRDTVREFIDLDNISAGALASLEGKPVVVDAHEWQTADSDGSKVKEIGAVAGKPRMSEDGYLVADLVIKDAEAIERIKSKDLVEISAGYMAVTNPEPGEFEGEAFDLSQDVTRFNHVVILPKGKGRCGREVKILNAKDAKGKNMPVKIERQIGNSVEQFTFESEDDAREAKRMCDMVAAPIEARRQNAEDAVAEKEEEAQNLKKENEDLTIGTEELKAQLAAISARLEKLEALEVKEQEADEDVILTEELNSEDEEKKVKDEVAKENSLEGRRKVIVSAVARMNSLDASGWTQDAVDAQFQMLAAKSRKSAEFKQKSRPRSSEFELSDSFKRQNSGERGNRIVERALKRLEAHK